jgi:antitoxin ParD1/3/4
MLAEKLSISLSPEAVAFIEAYRAEHAIRSRSQVVEHAIRLLREQSLDNAYREASGEVDAAWNITNSEGLADKTW